MKLDDYPRFRLFLPGQSVGASLVYWDMFNRSDTGVKLAVWSVIPIIDASVAHTGVVGITLHLTRTTAVGTGGTAATRGGTAVDAATFTSMDEPGAAALPGGVTARLTPTGGATAGVYVSMASIMAEELSAQAFLAHTNDFVRRNYLDVGPLWVRQNQGIRVVQGSVAATGVVGFDVIFTVIPNA